MKTALSLTLIFTLASFAAFSSPRSHVEVIQMGNKNLFVITSAKIDRGGEVCVVSSNGEWVMLSRKVEKRRIVIDFHDVEKGTYTIEMKKGEHVEKFQFVKR